VGLSGSESIRRPLEVGLGPRSAIDPARWLVNACGGSGSGAQDPGRQNDSSGRSGRSVPNAEDPGTSALVPFSAERLLRAEVGEIWRLWTTAEALARWWGPEDVVTTVERLDVRVGGAIEFGYVYAATANDPRRRQEFEDAGIVTSYRARGTFDEVIPFERLAFRQQVEFGLRSPPFEYRMRVDLRPGDGGVRVRLTAENEANAHWATLARANLVGQLDRMERSLRAPSPG
jgi:uncharacterized protein YndB with AHSA1/START domain